MFSVGDGGQEGGQEAEKEEHRKEARAQSGQNAVGHPLGVHLDVDALQRAGAAEGEPVRHPLTELLFLVMATKSQNLQRQVGDRIGRGIDYEREFYRLMPTLNIKLISRESRSSESRRFVFGASVFEVRFKGKLFLFFRRRHFLF